LISIAISEIDTKFTNLALLEASNWVEPEKVMMKVKKPAAAANGAEPSIAKPSIAKPLIAKPIVAKASAGLKAMIEAKRRAKAEAEAATASNVPSTSAQATVKITGAEGSGKLLTFFALTF
jgi:hypothetical protein